MVDAPYTISLLLKGFFLVLLFKKLHMCTVYVYLMFLKMISCSSSNAFFLNIHFCRL